MQTTRGIHDEQEQQILELSQENQLLREDRDEATKKLEECKKLLEKEQRELEQKHIELLAERQKLESLTAEFGAYKKSSQERIEELESLYANKGKECDNLRINLKQYLDKISKG